jgi:hypothetical protein
LRDADLAVDSRVEHALPDPERRAMLAATRRVDRDQLAREHVPLHAILEGCERRLGRRRLALERAQQDQGDADDGAAISLEHAPPGGPARGKAEREATPPSASPHRTLVSETARAALKIGSNGAEVIERAWFPAAAASGCA